MNPTELIYLIEKHMSPLTELRNGKGNTKEVTDSAVYDIDYVLAAAERYISQPVPTLGRDDYEFIKFYGNMIKSWAERLRLN